MKDNSQLEKKIGVTFKNKDLLKEALTHRSYLNENPSWPHPHNERLEFLGDAVIELIITEVLFKQFPDKPEGELTSLRAALVNANMLFEISKKIGFNEYIKLSRGESKDTGRARQYILANTFEAITGAMYLDQGIKTSKIFLEKYLLSRLPDIISNHLYKDPKSLFQEKAQEYASVTPHYEVLKEQGPDHDKHFSVGVYLADEMIAKGDGPSKQAAQEEAAKKALEIKGWEYNNHAS